MSWFLKDPETWVRSLGCGWLGIVRVLGAHEAVAEAWFVSGNNVIWEETVSFANAEGAKRHLDDLGRGNA